MEKGDIYKKHVRGSRYVISNGRLYYKFPGNQKVFTNSDVTELFEDFCDIRRESGGRIIINEEKEVITYRKESGNKWVPYYVGKLKSELDFESIDINPIDLKPGLVWTGFCIHHGSRFTFQKRGKILFKESSSKEFGTSINKYLIDSVEKEFIDRLKFYKIESGGFYINENQQVWAPVQKLNIDQFYIDEKIHKNEIKNQLPVMTTEQKRSIQQYTEYTNNGKDLWLPIYLGKYEKPLEIKRADKPHIIKSEDMLDFL